jgi:hypothetical protein
MGWPVISLGFAQIAIKLPTQRHAKLLSSFDILKTQDNAMINRPFSEVNKMSIKTRIEDANILLKLDRKEGALLSALVAVAATSRKRYPDREKIKDNKAFKKFISEELSKYGPGWSENTKVNIQFRGKKLMLPDVLYKLVRCELAHEAEIPEFISFKNEKGLNITILDNKEITFSNEIILYLIKIVVEAPENNDLFNNK